MSQSATKQNTSNNGAGLWHKFALFFCGIAADYWKDGKDFKFDYVKFIGKKTAPTKVGDSAAAQKIKAKSNSSFAWRASGRPQIIEALWGDGHCLPGGDSLIDTIMAPISLEDDKDVLDLSANMGAIGRRLALRFDAYTTGFEDDEEIAKHGAELSAQVGRANQATVEAYDPNSFVSSRQYSFIVVRELFYRIADKSRLFKEINRSLKPKEPRGQMVFTDYILEDDQRNNPAVAQWLAHEKNAQPIPLEDLIKTFEKNNVDVRIKEDLTKAYINEIFRALSRFTQFLQKYPPDHDTKVLIAREIELWSFRIAAFKNGLKFYRFYGIKN